MEISALPSSSNAFTSDTNSEGQGQTLQTMKTLNEKRRTTLKQLKSFMIVVGVFFLCWFPFLVLLALQTYGNEFTKTIFQIFQYTYYPAYLNSGLNPVIYALRMKDFKLAALRLCRRRIYPYLKAGIFICWIHFTSKNATMAKNKNRTLVQNVKWGKIKIELWSKI